MTPLATLLLCLPAALAVSACACGRAAARRRATGGQLVAQ
jgi:hypothetical protein